MYLDDANSAIVDEVVGNGLLFLSFALLVNLSMAGVPCCIAIDSLRSIGERKIYYC